jgi:hypothetical protein
MFLISVRQSLTEIYTDVTHQDGSLQRCFGEKTKVADCDWSYLSGLRTIKAPHEPMPRLVDLLEYLAQPGREQIWVLLDIKVRPLTPPCFDGGHWTS